MVASSSCCAVAETFRGDAVVEDAVGVGHSWREHRMDVDSTCCWPQLDGDGLQLRVQDVALGASNGSLRTCGEPLQQDVPTWRTVDGQRHCSGVEVGLQPFGRDCAKWDLRRKCDVDAAFVRIAGGGAAAVAGGDPFFSVKSRN